MTRSFGEKVFAKGFLRNDPMFEMIFTHQKIPIKGKLFKHKTQPVF